MLQTLAYTYEKVETLRTARSKPTTECNKSLELSMKASAIAHPYPVIPKPYVS